MAQTPGQTDYAQIQEDEIQVLQSIYDEDFVEEEIKTGAWNKKTERGFNIKIKPPSYPETGLFIVLHIQLPTTYPKTAPILKPDFSEDVPVKARKIINTLMKDMIKNLLGQEMIYDIAERVQSELDITASRIADAQDVPTLVEERAAQQAEAKQKEEGILAEKREQQKSAEDEEERMLQDMVESVRAKQKKHHSVKVSFSSDAPISDGSFDTKVKMKDREGVVKEFNAISNKTKYRVGPVTTLYSATAVPLASDSMSFPSRRDGDESEEGLPFLIVKECLIPAAKPSARLNQAIESLETDLRSLQELQPHPGVCNPVAFRLEKIMSTWVVRVLLPFHERGSPRDLIETIGSLDANLIRAWTIQLLEALDFLHRHRIVHGRISADNILLEKTATGGTVVKFCDILFQHELHVLQNASAKFSSASSAYWIAPEVANQDIKPTATKDVWDLGIVLLQMAFGMDVQHLFNSPNSLIEGKELSEAFEDLVELFFKADPKKRPGPFNLVANEFLRSDKPILDHREDDTEELSRTTSRTSAQRWPKPRRGSFQVNANTSRYAHDFVEQGRLGKGGFGEVVRARNKLDGTIYAIKKITQTSKTSLSTTLSEVVLLSRLNNPFIVRYYTAWIEEDTTVRRVSFEGEHHGDDDDDDEERSTYSFADESISRMTSSRNRGLDFISSQSMDMGGIEFGYDTDDEEAIEATDEETESDEEISHTPPPVAARRRRSSIVNLKVTLYIQMEYCERQTLRDLIRDNLHNKTEECWRLFRQILEGLVYIHSNGVIHRDLKPENVFISLDQSNTVRIGDFGLARAGEATTKIQRGGFTDPRLTASIGTSIYVAPEVKSTGGGSYNDKADMYSLGIILFEMSYPVKTGMERQTILNALRQEDPKLPDDFNKPLNAEIILELVKHKVSERPSSRDLLRSGRIPSHVEDETIRSALRSLADKASPYYTRFIKGLFAQGLSDSSMNFAYDMETGLKYGAQEQMLNSWIHDQMVKVFRRHGAVKVQRPKLLPYSSTYYGDEVSQFLTPDGNVIQLPYDLTMPFARLLAKSDVSAIAKKSFTFGSVFREAQPGVHPIIVGEVDFDIVSDNSLDIALREAEAMKVMDEIIDCIPSLADASISYHISHSKLLNAILAWCKIPEEKSAVVKHRLSKLNIGQWSWARIKTELRSSELAIPSTCLEDLARFNFRDTYSNAVQKLRAIFQDTEELESTFRHLEAVTAYLGRFHVKRDILINPLASFNEKFYRGNVLFQCIHRVTRKKKVTNEVLCAGGRYDKLIRDPRGGFKSGARHAVGFNLSWNNVTQSMAAYQQQTEAGKAFLKKTDDTSSGLPKSRRCDVLIDSVDPAVLRSVGIRIVQELWANEISAELVIDSDVRESKAHHQQNRDDATAHDWIVLIKQDEVLRVRSMITKEDTEIRSSELISWIRMEMRERERVDGAKNKPQLRKDLSEGVDREADVSVLSAESRSKKTNRRTVIEDAQARTSELSQTFLDSPIAAVELKDVLFEGIRDTRLSDPDSWRKYIQSAPLADRQYLSQLHELLLEKASSIGDNKASRTCWVYNFRTRACLLYDLGKAVEK